MTGMSFSSTQLHGMTRDQRWALELLASEPHGATDGLLVLVHGLQIKMLAGLVHEGLATAIVGEGIESDGKTIEVVRIAITDAGRRAIG